jgi:hypothetical protein
MFHRPKGQIPVDLELSLPPCKAERYHLSGRATQTSDPPPGSDAGCAETTPLDSDPLRRIFASMSISLCAGGSCQRLESATDTADRQLLIGTSTSSSKKALLRIRWFDSLS